MGVPKRRSSKSKARIRNANDFLPEKSLSICPQCQEQKLPHRVCLNCGYYGDKQVLELKSKK